MPPSTDPAADGQRMTIACTHCAKAKAKCDKKFPCSRCVAKQIECQSRATRRSSHAPSRRPTHGRAQSEHMLTTGPFHMMQLPTPPEGAPGFAPGTHHMPMQPHGLLMQDVERQLSLHGGPDFETQYLQSTFPHSPVNTGVTIPPPVVPQFSAMDDFPQLNTHFEHEGDSAFLGSGLQAATPGEFEMSSVMELMSPPNFMGDFGSNVFGGSTLTPASSQASSSIRHGSEPVKPRPDIASPLHQTQRFSSPSIPSPPISPNKALDREAMLTSLDSWPFFRCNPLNKSSKTPPKTQRMYVEGLVHTLSNRSSFDLTQWTSQTANMDLLVEKEYWVEVAPMSSTSRETWVAVVQWFLTKALQIHRTVKSRENSPEGVSTTGIDILRLPPDEVINSYLRSYILRAEPYCSIHPNASTPDFLLLHEERSTASLLLLLMVAQGALTVSTSEARCLASGLTEACRISLFDMIEKDIYRAHDPLLLQSALLFVLLAVWSGDKWHMDIGMGQRGMYLAMLSHSGLLLGSSEPFLTIGEANVDMLWKEWREHESRSRLAYSWVSLDQELSLFNDTAPSLPLDHLRAPIPDSQLLWGADTAAEWKRRYEMAHGPSLNLAESVSSLFPRLVSGELSASRRQLSPWQLRALLHPLHAFVCQERQFLDCMTAGGNQAKGARVLSATVASSRLENMSAIVDQWYTVFRQSFRDQEGLCWTTIAALIMYHLIALNSITSFSSIEKFARREVSLEGFREPTWLQMRAVDEHEEALFHCGQVWRLIRLMPEPVRPLWWPGALYRASLVAWATCTAIVGTRSPVDPSTTRFVALDALTPEDPTIQRFRHKREGVPVLTSSHHLVTSLETPINVINYSVEILQRESTTRLGDGISRKLQHLAERWLKN